MWFTAQYCVHKSYAQLYIHVYKLLLELHVQPENHVRSRMHRNNVPYSYHESKLSPVLSEHKGYRARKGLYNRPNRLLHIRCNLVCKHRVPFHDFEHLLLPVVPPLQDPAGVPPEQYVPILPPGQVYAGL